MFLFALLLICIASSSSTEKNTPTQFRSNVGGRIIGGTPARAGQFRFAAAITVETSNSRFFCGGALISNEWILTAGRCVDGAILFTIRLGVITLSEDDPNGMLLATSDYILHPDYDPVTLANDIALIRLRIQIPWTPYVEAIYLPFKNVDDYKGITAIGWGQTSDSATEFSDELMYVWVTAITNLECSVTYGNQVTDSMICVNGNFNEGACIGDSGSALIEYNNASATTWLAGIASFVSGNGCESTDPSGYTRVVSHKPWLTNITGIY